MARQRPKLVRDSTGRLKIKVSLPGGRYQLSLDDGGANLVKDRLGYDIGGDLPILAVRTLVATGDAWFPHQRDYQSVLNDLPTDRSATVTERKAIADYLRSRRVPEARLNAVQQVIENSRLQDSINVEEIRVNELPSVPDGIFDEENGAGSVADELTGQADSSVTKDVSEGVEEAETTSQDGATETGVGDISLDSIVERVTTETGADAVEVTDAYEKIDQYVDEDDEAVGVLLRWFDQTSELTIFSIPGIGLVRGSQLFSSGVDSIEEIAESRPTDLAQADGVTEDLATVAVEGARELLDNDRSTAERLAAQTGESAETFEAALSQLAAAGVPYSAAEPVLRRTYGPSIAAVDGVDGRRAYFLTEAGYETPWELARAAPDELEKVEYLGETTAERIVKSAREMIDMTASQNSR